MDVMFVLLSVALLFAGGALGVFVWAARSGPFDDVCTPGLRILHEDEGAPPHAPGRPPASRASRP